jgi:hypothetical protein
MAAAQRTTVEFGAMAVKDKRNAFAIGRSTVLFPCLSNVT